MATLIAIAIAAFTGAVGGSHEPIKRADAWQEYLRSPTAVLPMTKERYGIGYEGAKTQDVVALVRPIGDPVIKPVPGNSHRWYAEQQFMVLDSPDHLGATMTAYYVVHGMPDPADPSQQRYVPARPMSLDEGKFLLVGRKQPSDSVKFEFEYVLMNESIPVEPNEDLKATVAGLFPVTGVAWAESGPRWRFVMETIAASMAHARASALDDITFLLRRDYGTHVPEEPNDAGYGERDRVQQARMVRIVQDMLVQATSTLDRLYFVALLVEYGQSKEQKPFAEAMYKLVVEEQKDVPADFPWPAIRLMPPHVVRPQEMLPYKALQTKLLEIAERTTADNAAYWALGKIEQLEDTGELRRYYALVAQRTVGVRQTAYEKLIRWLNLADVTLQIEDDGHGRTVRIVNEEAVRSRISARLGTI
jgi:hypothetical protein